MTDPAVEARAICSKILRWHTSSFPTRTTVSVRKTCVNWTVVWVWISRNGGRAEVIPRRVWHCSCGGEAQRDVIILIIAVLRRGNTTEFGTWRCRRTSRKTRAIRKRASFSFSPIERISHGEVWRIPSTLLSNCKRQSWDSHSGWSRCRYELEQFKLGGEIRIKVLIYLISKKSSLPVWSFVPRPTLIFEPYITQSLAIKMIPCSLHYHCVVEDCCANSINRHSALKNKSNIRTLTIDSFLRNRVCSSVCFRIDVVWEKSTAEVKNMVDLVKDNSEGTRVVCFIKLQVWEVEIYRPNIRPKFR